MRRHISLMELLNGRFDCRLSMRVPRVPQRCGLVVVGTYGSQRYKNLLNPKDTQTFWIQKIQNLWIQRYENLSDPKIRKLLKSNNTDGHHNIINTYYLPPSSAHSSMSGETPTHKQQTKAQRPTMKMKQNHHAHAHGMNMNTPCPPSSNPAPSLRPEPPR